MPLLDVSFMTADPMLSDIFTLTRRLNLVGPNGRVSANLDQVFENCRGVITQQDPSDIIRTEDGQMVPRRILLCTRLLLVPLGPDYQPDEVLWNDTVYTVESVLPYSRFGAGTYEGICLYRGPVPPFQ